VRALDVLGEEVVADGVLDLVLVLFVLVLLVLVLVVLLVLTLIVLTLFVVVVLVVVSVSVEWNLTLWEQVSRTVRGSVSVM
jgi:hypothetical protein